MLRWVSDVLSVGYRMFCPWDGFVLISPRCFKVEDNGAETEEARFLLEWSRPATLSSVHHWCTSFFSDSEISWRVEPVQDFNVSNSAFFCLQHVQSGVWLVTCSINGAFACNACFEPGILLVIKGLCHGDH